MVYLIAAAVAVAVAVIVALVAAYWIVSLRRVVPTNEVHIVQGSNGSTVYGKDRQEAKVTSETSTYYEWPMWIPKLGVQVIKLPVSNFPIRLSEYSAYDQARLPLVLDIEAFFRIEDATVAATRISSIKELEAQLRSILEGAARSLIASKDIHTIMGGRSEIGEAFTEMVRDQLKEWGTAPVKSIELMDIRDAKGSSVILNIMEEKKSEIERNSRTTVAENMKLAQEAEVAAARQVSIARELAEKQVGIAAAEKTREIGIATELANQQIKEQQRITTEKHMEVLRVEEVKKAEITKDVEIVKAQEQRATEVERAEGDKQKTILISEGELTKEANVAKAIELRGAAEAEAKKLLELAPVEAQIVLAKEIGSNENYQNYLISLRNADVSEKVGIEQAKALVAADVKIIANGSTVADGASGIGGILSSAGGQKAGSMLEGLANTPIGAELIGKFLGSKD